MKTMASKYPGTCGRCGKGFERGTYIKYFGRGRAVEHLDCYPVDHSKPVAPCWLCHNPEGRFRAMGAATPVWCDACFEKEKAKTVTICNVRFQRSSVEDYPCSDMGYEDQCAAACGPGL